jgi:SanA protein
MTIAVAAAIYLATISLVAALAVGEWVRQHNSDKIYLTFDTVPERFVAIVPGASVTSKGQPSAVLLDRLETARQLYLRGKVRRILVSGDNRTRYYNEPQAMRHWLTAHGVPDRDIYADYAGYRTLDTMERAAQIFQVREAIVCTQAFHLHRSVFLARQAGVDAVGMVSDRREYRRDLVDRFREYAARTLAFADIFLLDTEPHLLGPPVPIDGPPQHREE